MSGEDAADGGSNAPVDRGALVRILDRIRTNRQIVRAYITLIHRETCLLAEFDLDYYPSDLQDAYLNVRWYTNDDFKLHYHESWESGNWDCRWDRHPNSHNTYDHFHPPPNAPTQGEDDSYPDDLHEVMRLVEEEINVRIRSLWKGDT